VLLSTGEIVLAEAAPNDRIWGVGLKLGDPRLQDEQTWQGQNVLGKALMKARAHIRDSKEGGAMATDAPAFGLAAAPPAKEVVLGFYGHSAKSPYREFSNFYESGDSFRFELPAFARTEEEFPLAVDCEFSEKAIMLTKAALMGDRETFDRIEVSKSPAECNGLGRQVQNFDDSLWNKHLDEVAFEVLRQKFSADDSLRNLLLSTGDVIIAEATRNDRIWGIGIDVGDARVQDQSQWRGRNVLGRGLMRVRELLQREEAGGMTQEGEDTQEPAMPPLKKKRWNQRVVQPVP